MMNNRDENGLTAAQNFKVAAGLIAAAALLVWAFSRAPW